MLNLQSLTQDESKTLSINLERLLSLIEQLFYKENDTPTTEDGFNPWEVVRDTIKHMSNKQFLDVMELVKGIAVSKNTSAEDKLVAIDTVSKIVQLKTNTERNTYLSLGMFGLCQ